jgi:hypothetical protein
MMLSQPVDVAGPTAIIIPFAGRVSRTGLSLRDRMEVASWQAQADHYGYDRMVIHERAACDPPDVDSFLSIYRQGEAWARWGLARCGSTVLAWCSVTGADIGRYATIGEALRALFPLSAGAGGAGVSGEVIQAFC